MILSKVKSAAVALAVVMMLGLSLAGSSPIALAAPREAAPSTVRTVQSGPWSAPATWEGGKIPAGGARVQVRTGHTVTYDLKSDQTIRSIHIAGKLTFARDRETRLDVGLIKLQPGDEASEDGFDCDAHMTAPKPGDPQPVLEVG